MRIIKQFEDGSILEYAQGYFDNWSIYLTCPNIERYAPKDYEYFERVRTIGEKYGLEQTYNDFVSIYNLTKKSIEPEVLGKITDLSKKYRDDRITVEIDFTIIYAGMVAEENKAFTKLGKRVKRLGMHQLLIDGLSHNEAANFSRKKYGMK